MDKRKPSTCYGEVYFKVDNALKRVCGSNWNKKNAEVVCKELNCGGVSFYCQASVARLKKKKEFMQA